MEAGDVPVDVVHPEVRAHVNSLVSALGGASAEDDGRYKLGDDALEVLRDLKRWIRFYDEKTNRMDVARCLADANLIEGDLLPILATWPENATDTKFKSRVALACFELMVPLTWPLTRDSERTTVNHYRHMPVLQLAQLAYKRAIINYDSARVLHSAIRVALSSMAVPIGDRTARDQGIIKLALFFLRNIAMIAPPPGVKYDGDESQISRSATIDAFSYQDIFLFLLTIASNMGEDFRTEDVTVMEVIYHLVKLVDVEKLFMNEQQLNKSKTEDLADMMSRETAMLKGYKKGATRHNRFGTMVWVKRENGKVSTVSGQDALRDAATRQQKIDNTKTFRPPRRPRKKDDAGDLGSQPKLNARADDQLRTFAQDFLDSGFNPLFQHLRKTIDRDAPHLLGYHQRQFFYLVAWFLQAERIRRRLGKAASGPQPTADNVSSFSLVAGVLNQEMFVTLSRAMHNAYNQKEWAELTAVMRCFTEILLTVHEMTESGNEEDEEIADNTLGRLFYEDATHDCVADIVRTYKDQDFEYLDAATELTHHFLRILEAYSKQNVDMQVRSRKRVRRKRKAAKVSRAGAADAQGSDAEDNGRDEDVSENDEANAERTSKERKFDFKKFAARFTPQGVVDTFISLIRHFRDLNDGQLKRAHRYFYRVAFKLDMAVMLFRVDIIHLFYAMIKGPEALDRASAVCKEWEELSKQVLRKCVRKMQERPQLAVEMLFSKTSSTAFFLERGFDKPTTTTTAASRSAAEVEFRGNPGGRDRQIAIVVGALLDKNCADLVTWLKGVLVSAEVERSEWENVQEAIATGTRMGVGRSDGTEAASETAAAAGAESSEAPTPYLVRAGDDAVQWTMFKNPHLRLLMKLCGIARLTPTLDETPDSAWVVAPEITSAHLKDTIKFISQAEFSPPVFDEGVLAEHQLRRKPAPRKRATYDDDDDKDLGIVGDDDDDILFAPGGPTARKVIDGEHRPKKTQRRRRTAVEEDGEEELAADSEVEEKRRKRREKELEKARKVKSALFIDDEDDEWDGNTDAAFFAREEAIRQQAQKVAANVSADPTREPAIAAELDQALLRYLGGDDDDEEDVDMDGDNDREEEEEARITVPLNSAPGLTSRKGNSRKRRRLSDGSSGPEKKSAIVDMDTATEDDNGGGGDDDDDDDEAVAVIAARPRRARMTSGFVDDSDDE